MQKRLTAASIENVKAASIVEVIGHFITLKNAGANKQACCPFHAEKSASFIVSETKGIYKCFGCSAAGDAIRFVMEHEKQTFVEAVETIAKITGLELEYETKELTEKEKLTLDEATQQEQVLNLVVPFYARQLFELPETHPVKQYLHSRGFTNEIQVEWQMGWAGSEWRTVTPWLIEKNMFAPAEALGIIKRGKVDNTNFDGYRCRITIPITDRHGKYIGLVGRVAPEYEQEIKGKYINTTDCALYNKSSVWFGLDRAAAAIKENKMAIAVEGNLDVIAMHTKGIGHVVGTSGTAFTDGHLQLIKRHTTNVACMFDNDAAGQKAFVNALDKMLPAGINVQRVIYTEKDPDQWAHKQETENLKLQMEDGLIFRARTLMEDAGQDIMAQVDAKTIILETIARVQNEILRTNYLETICTKYKWNKADTKKQFSNISDRLGMGAGKGPAAEEETSSIAFASWVEETEKEEFFNTGYLPVNKKQNGKPLVGYYSFNGNGKVEISNFIVNPLFHVYAGIESRYLLEIHNGYRKAVLDMPAKTIPAIDQFQAYTVSEGNFLIFGAKAQWLRIASDLLQKFPRCMELKNLGWQQWGFFAFVDKIYNPKTGMHDLDNWGIYGTTTDGKPKTENYLIPASCEAYRQLQHTGEDPFENDRHLTYIKAPINFSTWAKKMQRVWLQKGAVGVAAVIMAVFRDLVFDVDNNCPHVYAFGEPSSGKSKWADSISAVFYHRRPAFNLNSGTDFAFFAYMQRYKNAPAQLNEFDIEVIKQEWFQAIKGVFDGEGRERGKGGSKNRTEIMKVHSVLVLTGQKLITADDNSVVTRSLIEPFSVRENITEEDKKEFNELKDLEHNGLSSLLIELLAHREYFQANYKNQFNGLLSKWRKESGEARAANMRILQNYAHLATCYAMAAAKIELEQSAEDFTAYCLERAAHWSRFIRSSDTLSEFWRTLEFLVNNQEIIEGWDYTIVTETQVRIRKSKTDEFLHVFQQPTKVLYLRLNNAHKLFQQTYRARSGKEAMTIENLLHYMSSRKYFLGAVKQRRFKRYITKYNEKPVGGYSTAVNVLSAKEAEEQNASCHAFIYDDLGVEIEKFGGGADPDATGTPGNGADDLPF